ncbi:hypothetical protein M441DRAFT_155097, partial [Trichoderma asperellum CBS 433.97]
KRINYMLELYLNDFIIIYINNILIFLNIFKEYKKYIYFILQKLKENKLFINFKKYIFYF